LALFPKIKRSHSFARRKRVGRKKVLLKKRKRQAKKKWK